MHSIEILLVEDSPGDIRLTQEALNDSKFDSNLHVVNDGERALHYLRKESGYEHAIRPDIILLDLNLPRKDGREVLAEVKEDRDLKRIPIVVLTTSDDEQDVLTSYDLHANCYITKPVDLENFDNIVKTIEDFWFQVVKLPPS